MKRFGFFLFFLFSFFLSLPVFAGSKEVILKDAVRWTYKGRWSAGGGKPMPAVWSPWLPLPAQVGFRAKMGFRVSPMRINVKGGLKVKLSWDKDHPRAGDRVKLQISVEPVKTLSPTLDVAFGLYLPTKVETGVIGIPFVTDNAYIPGVGHVGWYDLNVDLWELVQEILSSLEVTETVAQLLELRKLGINARTTEPIPMSGSK